MRIKRKSIVTSALILTIASIVTRIFGFVYRIYMSNTIGAEGMGLYQLIMPLYSLAWSISCAGFTTTVSKLVAQENAKLEYGNMGRVLKQALVITGVISFALTFLMFTFSGFVSTTMLGDSRVELSLKILALALPFMAFGSVIRGYFFGLRQTVVPAISQVFEQSIRMLVIYALSSFFVPRGLEYACAAAVIGILFGEILSFLYVLFAYRLFKTKNKLNKKPNMPSMETFYLIVSMATPLALSRVTGSLLSTFENVLIPQRLQMFGYNQTEALSLYGQVTGMALPLIFFPSALLVALSTTLVPSVSEAMAVNNLNKVSNTISKSMMFTALVGIGASTIFLVLPYELGYTIYKQDISSILFMLGLMCPFWYMAITFNGILNGLGQQLFMFRNGIFASIISIGGIMVFVPRYGINAFIISWFASLVITTLLDVFKIKSCTNIKIPFLKWFIKPALAALAIGLVVKYINNNYIRTNFSDAFSLIIAMALLGIGYLIFILMLGCIKISDIQSLFKGFTKKKEQEDPNRVKEKLV